MTLHQLSAFLCIEHWKVEQGGPPTLSYSSGTTGIQYAAIPPPVQVSYESRVTRHPKYIPGWYTVCSYTPCLSILRIPGNIHHPKYILAFYTVCSYIYPLSEYLKNPGHHTPSWDGMVYAVHSHAPHSSIDGKYIYRVSVLCESK